MIKTSLLGRLRPVTAAAVAATALLVTTASASASPRDRAYGPAADDRVAWRATLDARVAVEPRAWRRAEPPRAERRVALRAAPRARGERSAWARAGELPMRPLRFDLDRDGVLDAYERAAGAEQLRQESRRGTTVGHASLARTVRISDRDRDGRLSDRELGAMLGEGSLMQVFAAADRNHDRMVAYTELAAMPMLEDLRRADLDRSGYLSWQELDRYVSVERRVGVDRRGRTARRARR